MSGRAVLWRKRHKPSSPAIPRWGRVMRRLIGTVVIVAFGQLFEGQYASAYPAAGSPPVHQPEIHAARDLVDIPVANRSVDIDSHVARGDGSPFCKCQHATCRNGSKVDCATGTESGASIARLHGIELRV